MADLFNFNAIDSLAIQSASYYILFIVLGIVAVALVAWLVFMWWKAKQYKIKVYIDDEVGDTILRREDWARIVKISDEDHMHYRYINKYSPRIDSKYFKLLALPGLFPKVVQSVRVGKKGDKIFPIYDPSFNHVQPIDYDAWNWLVGMLRMIEAKYKKQDELMKILPYLALGAVVLMFILGNLFWGMHIEKVARMILDTATQIGQRAMEQSGAVQVIGG